jgi:hypothetical protein
MTRRPRRNHSPASDEGGGIIEAEIHLTKRPKLFRQTEPALSGHAFAESPS